MLIMVFLLIFDFLIFWCVTFAWKSVENVGINSNSSKWIFINALIFAVVVAFTLINGRCLILAIENGAPEYRVVNACPQEILKNEATQKYFQRNDICKPNIFNRDSTFVLRRSVSITSLEILWELLCYSWSTLFCCLRCLNC